MQISYLVNYIVFDLEATCWRDSRAKRQNEIIEIGALLINDHGEIKSEFCQFVRPKLHPHLSSFCKKLTSIEQYQIDRAKYFPYVLRDFQNWIGEDYLLCSWGYYDKKQLLKDCELHGLDTIWLNQHISIKHQYGALKKLKQHIGVKKALELENLNFEGTYHRGIDDARNIAKIFVRYLEQWEGVEKK